MSGEFGYAGEILRVNLSSGENYAEPTEAYAEYIGGRGLAAKIYWDEVSPETKAFDPDNRLMFLTGPFTGFAGLSPRWQVYGKSPLTDPEQFCYCNLGGTWGVALKFAGYDGIVVQGKADKPVYLLVDEGGVHVREASHLWGRGAIESREILKSELGESVNVVACGQAGENLVVHASLLADRDSSGSGGLGAVMGSKKLKAIAVRKRKNKLAAAHPDRVRDLIKYSRRLLGEKFKLLEYEQYVPLESDRIKKDFCWGCPGPCMRMKWKAGDGKEGKYFCQSVMVYQVRAKKYYGEEGDVPFKATKLCDDYGLDTKGVNAILTWLSRCHRAGLLTEEETGIPLSEEGSLEYLSLLLHKVAFREGFGDVLAQGVGKAAEIVGKGTKELIGDTILKADVDDIYGPRVYIVNGLLYAMEPRQPMQQLHEASIFIEQWLDWVYGREGAYVTSDIVRAAARRFWGNEDAGDFTSYKGKALAGKMTQDRQYVKESLILCDILWPIIASPNTEDHLGDPSLESKLYTAVTGREMDETGLYQIGERLFNLQRAILAREGHVGRQSDTLSESMFTIPLRHHFINPECLVPGPGDEPVSRIGAVVERDEFERMKDEYYQLRGWDVDTGKQTRSQLEKLGLGWVADELEPSGLLA
ncbi:aldehyde ferredoxin oxidoreductase N-terminal domain-containing protein [Thermodesulfobacteriota bacterium]